VSNGGQYGKGESPNIFLSCHVFPKKGSIVYFGRLAGVLQKGCIFAVERPWGRWALKSFGTPKQRQGSVRLNTDSSRLPN
jgi:hypothetical protein